MPPVDKVRFFGNNTGLSGTPSHSYAIISTLVGQGVYRATIHSLSSGSPLPTSETVTVNGSAQDAVNKAIDELKKLYNQSKEIHFKWLNENRVPRPGSWSVGFATNENSKQISSKINDTLVNVFIPTTPNPTSGFLVLIPKKDIIYLNMNFEDAMKFIISVGAIGELK